MKHCFLFILIVSTLSSKADISRNDSIPNERYLDIKLNLLNALVDNGYPAPHLEYYFNKNTSVNVSYYHYDFEFFKFSMFGYGGSFTYRKHLIPLDFEFYRNYLFFGVGMDYMKRYMWSERQFKVIKDDFYMMRLELGSKTVIYKRFVTELVAGYRFINGGDFPVLQINLGCRLF